MRAKLRRIQFAAAFALLAIAGLHQNASATTIDPLTWEQLATGADFIGIVECTTAGGIVAKYRVVEAWKGSKVGATVAIRIAPNYWGPQFPIALVGQKFLVTAYKSPPSTMSSTTMGGPVVEWWREIPSDFSTPLFQGRAPLGGKPFFSSISFTHKDLASLRRDMKALLALDSDRSEARVIASVLRKNLLGRGQAKDRRAKKIARALSKTTTSALLTALFKLLRSEKDLERQMFYSIADAGGQHTRAALDKMSRTKLPFTDDQLKDLKRRLAASAGPVVKPIPPPTPKAPPITALSPAEISKYRADLATGPQSRGFGKAFEELTVHSPADVAASLAAWKPDPKARHNIGRAMSAFFGQKCGSDCSRHLGVLARSANDEWVRVAAGIHLTFYDKRKGLAALRILCRLPGDAGVWAALALARRGIRGAVPRLLQVFDKPTDSSMRTVGHGNLQKRALVLLSNSAAASGLPPLALSADKKQLSAWFAKNRPTLKMTDPWLPLLEKQRVD